MHYIQNTWLLFILGYSLQLTDSLLWGEEWYCEMLHVILWYCEMACMCYISEGALVANKSEAHSARDMAN